MKYKELPAFETNEFKEGDLIKVYSPSGDYEAEVFGISDSHPNFLQITIIRKYSTITQVHFKQCRKLEEVKPREYIRYVDEFGNLYKSGESYYFNGTEFMITEPTKRIKLREVLEE